MALKKVVGRSQTLGRPVKWRIGPRGGLLMGARRRSRAAREAHATEPGSWESRWHGRGWTNDVGGGGSGGEKRTTMAVK